MTPKRAPEMATKSGTGNGADPDPHFGHPRRAARASSIIGVSGGCSPPERDVKTSRVRVRARARGCASDDAARSGAVPLGAAAALSPRACLSAAAIEWRGRAAAAARSGAVPLGAAAALSPSVRASVTPR